MMVWCQGMPKEFSTADMLRWSCSVTAEHSYNLNNILDSDELKHQTYYFNMLWAISFTANSDNLLMFIKYILKLFLKLWERFLTWGYGVVLTLHFFSWSLHDSTCHFISLMLKPFSLADRHSSCLLLIHIWHVPVRARIYKCLSKILWSWAIWGLTMSITTLSGAWQHKQLTIVPWNEGDYENGKDRGKKKISPKIH